MSDMTHTTEARTDTVLDILVAPLRAMGGFLIGIAENNSRMRDLERLNSLSDAELERRGLKREDLARHVFRDAFGL